MAELTFLTDPEEFLAATRQFLAADPVLNTVVAVVTERAVADAAAGRTPDPTIPRWWVLARDEAGQVAGVGMRTATSAPYPPYLLPMPQESAAALGAALAQRGEDLGRINGVLATALACGEEFARLRGGLARIDAHSRLFECREVRMPTLPSGRLRTAVDAEAGLVLDWFEGFHAAADEQAGRPPGTRVDVVPPNLDQMRRRIAEGSIYLWETPQGEVVHLSAVNGPSFGVSRIGPVFTPDAHRGHGYASAAVAMLTRQILDSGTRACLFTDQANPTSNAIYQALGYEAVCDTGEVAIEPDPIPQNPGTPAGIP